MLKRRSSRYPTAAQKREREINNLQGTFVKARPIHDPKACGGWKEFQERCAACWRVHWRTYNAHWLAFDAHHLVKQGRSDEPCNWLFLCRTCHDLAEGNPRIGDGHGGYWPVLTFANCLWLKRDANPKEYDPKRLAELKHQAIPRPEKPELFFEKLGINR